jgi:hypothetical protein
MDVMWMMPALTQRGVCHGQTNGPELLTRTSKTIFFFFPLMSMFILAPPPLAIEASGWMFLEHSSILSW